MADYQEMQRQLWEEIKLSDKRLEKRTSAFFDDFMARMQVNGYTFDNAAKSALSSFYTGITQFLEVGISTAVSVSVNEPMQSTFVLNAMKEAFAERWDDGSILSDRLWQYEKITAKEIETTIRNSIAMGKSNSKLLYDIQFAIESNAGNQFEVISNNSNKWTRELKDSAKFLITNPKSKADFDLIVKQTQKYIDKLAVTGTKNYSQQYLNKIKESVKNGNQAAVDNALKWWVYDKQLYNTKRIARTEMANAGHNAVINTTLDDGLIIGYWWRLSPGHVDKKCLCNQYANVDMGLGIGVWSKELVPRKKPHPHCTCLLIPLTKRR